MPRSAEQHEAMRVATRDRVRTSATRLFSRRGFAAVNMRAIATEAGISTGSIYRHFATKEELFDDLVGQASRGLTVVAERFATATDPARALRSFTTEYLGDLSLEGDALEFYLLMHQAMAVPGPSMRELERAQRGLTEATVALLERGRRQGIVRTGPPHELATCLFATLNGLVTMRSALGERFTVPSVDTVLGVVLKGNEDG